MAVKGLKSDKETARQAKGTDGQIGTVLADRQVNKWRNKHLWQHSDTAMLCDWRSSPRVPSLC